MHAQEDRNFQKTASDSLELELEAIVSHLTWMLKTELRSSGRIKKHS